MAARWLGVLLLAAGVALNVLGAGIHLEVPHITLMFAGIVLGVIGLRKIFDPSGCGT